MDLPPAARRLVEEAEEAEAAGRTNRALELYNEGLALAMESLPRQPELKPTIEGYLRRAMKLQQPASIGSPGSRSSSADALAVGDRCRVETREPDGGFGRRVGTVSFAGPTVLGDGLWVGVTLDERVAGRHDGQVSGVRYFRCPPECGVLVRASRVERLTAPAPGSVHRTPHRRLSPRKNAGADDTAAAGGSSSAVQPSPAQRARPAGSAQRARSRSRTQLGPRASRPTPSRTLA